MKDKPSVGYLQLLFQHIRNYRPYLEATSSSLKQKKATCDSKAFAV